MFILFKQRGPFTTRLLMTLTSSAASVAIVIFLDLIIIGYISPVDILIGAITSGFLTWQMIGYFLRLLQKLRTTEDELKLLANEDYLTGLHNRRRFLELAETEWERARRLQYPLTMLMVDVDHFKIINDTYGHAAGDAALQHLAQILRQELRIYDMIGRFGGEEFAVLLPDTDAEAGFIIAERILTKISASSFLFCGNEITMTVSIGLAFNFVNYTGLEDLLVSADQAMYTAKDKGRNQVVRKSVLVDSQVV
jgi:diguanylate cyclase (GGDEF)-like protein